MTIAQQLKVKDFPFEIKDSKGNQIYYEDLYNYWCKYEFDANGNEIYCEYSNGYWCKSECDAKGNLIYIENSHGEIIDNRPKVTLTLDEVAEKFNISLDKLQIKK